MATVKQVAQIFAELDFVTLTSKYAKRDLQGASLRLAVEGDCVTLYSYTTPIARRWSTGLRSVIWVSTEKFSVTTSKQQNYVRYELRSFVGPLLETAQCPRDVETALVALDAQLEGKAV